MEFRKIISLNILQGVTVLAIILSVCFSAHISNPMEEYETIESEIELLFVQEKSAEQETPSITTEVKYFSDPSVDDMVLVNDQFIKTCHYKLFILYCNMSNECVALS